jgi:hypothetical protein
MSTAGPMSVKTDCKFPRAVLFASVMLVWLISACSAGSAPTATNIPTQALIPSTATDTSTPITPTATQPLLPGPQDVIATAPASAVDAIPGDPIAAELVTLAQRRIAQELDLPVRRVRLVEVIPVIWQDSSLGCPQPGQEYTSVNVDGYRIIIAAGSEEYIFHSDTERVTPCDAGDERLPETTPEVTSTTD